MVSMMHECFACQPLRNSNDIFSLESFLPFQFFIYLFSRMNKVARISQLFYDFGLLFFNSICWGKSYLTKDFSRHRTSLQLQGSQHLFAPDQHSSPVVGKIFVFPSCDTDSKEKKSARVRGKIIIQLCTWCR